MRKYENRPHLGNSCYQHQYKTRHGVVYVRLLIASVHSGSYIFIHILIIKMKSVKVQSKQTECTERLKEKLPLNFSKSKVKRIFVGPDMQSRQLDGVEECLLY